MRRTAWGGWVLALACAAWPGRADAQQAGADSLARRPLATRAELQDLATRLAAEDPGSPARAVIQTRLERGDFQAGDRIRLRVDGQQALSDTFAVGADQALTLPLAGPISLHGVLLSETQAYLSEQLGRVIRYALVDARPLMQISVQGAVERPGFYYVAPDAPIADALRAAGGTREYAQLDKTAIKRDGKPVSRGASLRRALAAGTTLDQARLQSGDLILVAGHPEGGLRSGLTLVWLVVSLSSGIYGLSRVIH